MAQLDLARALSVIVALLVAASGLIGLIARTQVSPRPGRRQLVAASFRLMLGLVLIVLVVAR